MCHCMNNLSIEEEEERQTKSSALLDCQLVVVVEAMRDISTCV